MSVHVLDSSAVLALILNEDGGDGVLPFLENSLISSVNHAEIVTRLVREGLSGPDLEEAVRLVSLQIEPLTQAQSVQAGLLYSAGRVIGLSLGDRCCLALALEKEATVVTADHAWLNIAKVVDLEIVVTRP